MDLSVVPYDNGSCGGVRYGECMRNHAAARGGQAYDGCGEFMPGGSPESPEFLMCAACGCHRSFHRRESGSGGLRRPMLRPIAYFPPPPLPLTYVPHHAAPIAGGHLATDRSRSGSETPPRAEDVMASAGGRKRNRTKFTPEQKEKMREFAERLGWRIQRHDDGALDRFCLEIGIERHVLKVWMHNHKNHLAASPSVSGGGAGVSPPPLTGGPGSAAAASVEAAAIRV